MLDSNMASQNICLPPLLNLVNGNVIVIVTSAGGLDSCLLNAAGRRATVQLVHL